ncbi:MAG: hypothetical protein JXL80_17515 [Planctomycetes bacterium]|nr:hypothetical protein [Planctomycetota bacterium]
MSRSVTYARSDDEVSLSAVPVSPKVAVDGEGNVLVSSSSRDWLLDVADLVLNGAAVEPTAGDTITDTDGTWMVVADAGTREWEYLDTTHLVMRVRTKLVGE